MHRAEMHQGQPRIWLLAGTGEGPVLAEKLLAAGWLVKLSLVSEAAALRYGNHPNLAIHVGPLGGVGAVGQVLDQANARGTPFAVVVDASHPFACQISAELAQGCLPRQQTLLRLWRPTLHGEGQVRQLANLEALAAYPWRGERLLWAIGARQLARAIALSPGALHHARILPSAGALKLAMAAGLGEGQVACVRPTEAGMGLEISGLDESGWEGSIEAALIRQWAITVAVARQSGGLTEARWRAVCQGLGVKLLLLERPSEPAGVECLPLAELLTRLSGIRDLLSRGAGPATQGGKPGASVPAG